ncbi:MAG: hypothetical protein KAS71_06680 [Bacteroidales bacterium]|nr:hypothetical protein [Bacteroidales bacterium]
MWTVSKAGDIHYLTSVGGTAVHYYKKAGENNFTNSTNCPPPAGDVFSVGEHILVVTLENGRPLIKTTLASENAWTTLLKEEKGDLYRHCNVTMADNKIFLCAMKKGKGEKQPITLLTYDVRFK